MRLESRKFINQGYSVIQLFSQLVDVLMDGGSIPNDTLEAHQKARIFEKMAVS